MGVCEGVSVTPTLCVYLYVRGYTPRWKYSVCISTCIDISPCIISFLLFTTVQKKNLKVVLFKRREIPSNPSFLSMFVHNHQWAAVVSDIHACLLAVVIKSGQHVLLPARKILWDKQVILGEEKAFLSPWGTQLSVISRECFRDNSHLWGCRVQRDVESWHSWVGASKDTTNAQKAFQLSTAGNYCVTVN